MNTNFFVAEDEVFNPNKVLTRKQNKHLEVHYEKQ